MGDEVANSEIKRLMQEFIKVDNEISVKAKELSKLRSHQKEMKRILQLVMEQKGVSSILTTDTENNPNKFEILEKESPAPLNLNTLKSIFLDWFDGDHEQAQKLANRIEEKRPIRVKTELKRKHF